MFMKLISAVISVDCCQEMNEGHSELKKCIQKIKDALILTGCKYVSGPFCVDNTDGVYWPCRQHPVKHIQPNTVRDPNEAISNKAMSFINDRKRHDSHEASMTIAVTPHADELSPEDTAWVVPPPLCSSGRHMSHPVRTSSSDSHQPSNDLWYLICSIVVKEKQIHSHVVWVDLKHTNGFHVKTISAGVDNWRSKIETRIKGDLKGSMKRYVMSLCYTKGYPDVNGADVIRFAWTITSQQIFFFSWMMSEKMSWNSSLSRL